MEDLDVTTSPASIEILYEDEHYIFINKPYDVVINSDDTKNKNTVHKILEKQLSMGNNEGTEKQTNILKHGFHFVNRLDYSTGGVMCLSKSKEGARDAGKLFQSRLVTKIYTALLRGHLDTQSIDIDVPVGYDVRYLQENKIMCSNEEFIHQGKSCRTRIILLETGFLNEEKVSHVVLKPVTGRRHQLRVHCKHIGHPIVGDYTYSDRQDTAPYRMYLHAYRLILPLPSKIIDVTAPENFIIERWKSLKIYSSLDDVLQS